MIVFTATLSGQAVQSLIVDFVKEYREKNWQEAETVSGTVYYQAAGRTLILVDKPLEQRIILDGQTMWLYYPQQNKAFRFTSSQNLASMPFFHTFLAVMKEDFGLAESGYKLDRYETKDDLFVSYWKPPEPISRVLGDTVLELRANRLTRFEIFDSKGKIISRAEFSNHQLYCGTLFPMEILTTRFQFSPSTEKVMFSNARFNAAIPAEIANFQIPVDAEVKEVAW